MTPSTTRNAPRRRTPESHGTHEPARYGAQRNREPTLRTDPRSRSVSLEPTAGKREPGRSSRSGAPGSQGGASSLARILPP